MTKRTDALRFILKGILTIGFSVQICFSLIWLILNFSALQPFSEDSGILYPVIVKLFKGIGMVVPIPYYCFIYFFQLVIAFLASWELCSSFKAEKIGSRIWFSLCLLSFPLAMQCHLAVLPYSLLSSMLLIILAQLYKYLKTKQGTFKRYIIVSCICLVIAGFLRIEYILFCSIPIVIMLINYVKKERKNRYRRHSVLAFLLSLALLLGAYSYVYIKDENLNLKDEFYSAIISRCGWSNFEKSYGYWPEDASEIVNLYDIYDCDRYPGKVKDEMVVPLKSLGDKRAKEVYSLIIKLSVSNNIKSIIHESFWDACGYMWSPLVMSRQLNGDAYEAKTGVNYGAMKLNTPSLTKNYVAYGNFWFAIFLIIILILFYHRKKIKIEYKEVHIFFSMSIPILVEILFYTLQGAGIMDYKKTIAIGLMWTFLALLQLQDFEFLK